MLKGMGKKNEEQATLLYFPGDFVDGTLRSLFKCLTTVLGLCI